MTGVDKRVWRNQHEAIDIGMYSFKRLARNWNVYCSGLRNHNLQKEDRWTYIGHLAVLWVYRLELSTTVIAVGAGVSFV